MRSAPKVMRMIFLCSAEGPGKESGGRGRWRGNPSMLMRTAYGDAVLSSAQVFRWHKAFKDGRESVEYEQRTGHPSTARTENNVARVKVLDRDRHLQMQLIAEDVCLLKTDVHQIITEDLHMRKICAKLVVKNLSDEQKDNCVLVSREILDCVKSEPYFLQGVLTGDETWVFEYDPTTKRQSSEWHTSKSPRPKKAQMSKSRVKSMLIIFLIDRALLTRSLCHLDTLWIKHFTYRYLNVWETELGASAVKLQTSGSFTMTMRQVTHHLLWGNFWLKIRSQRFPTHHTALTWLRVISFYSPSSKPTSKDIILGQLNTSRQVWRGLWTTSQVNTSSTAMKSGSSAGITVFDSKEPTLKGINCNCMYV